MVKRCRSRGAPRALRNAQMSETVPATREATKSFRLNPADVEDIATLRRDIHAHPELCFEEQRTSDLIANTLSGWGIPVHRGLGTTGVVGIIKNGSSDRALGLRAD